MKEKRINIAEKLKDCPEGTKLWSPLFGEVTLVEVYSYPYCIEVMTSNGIRQSFTKYGFHYDKYDDAECLLFPSKQNRNWGTFKPKKPKFDPKILQPFDRVLCRHKQTKFWFAEFASHYYDYNVCCIGNSGYYDVTIPFNEETKHLVGTNEEAPEFYKYWD